MRQSRKSGIGKPGGYINEFRTLLPYIKRYRWAYIIGVFFLVLTDAGQIIIPRLIGNAVDLIAAGRGNVGAVGRLMIVVTVLAAVVAVGRYGWRNFIIGSARRLEADLRFDLYGKLLTLSGSFFSRYKVGDLMARATNDLQSIRMATGMALIAFIDGSFMAIVILATLFVGYGSLGLIVVLPLPLVTLMALVLGRLIGPLFKRVQESFARISDHVQESLAGIRVIKSFVKEKRTLETFSEINSEYGKANMALVRFWGLLFPAMGFLAGLTVLLLLIFGGIRVVDGRLSPGAFVAALSYLGMLLWPAMGAGWVVNMIQRGAASMKRINEVFNEIPDITDLENASAKLPSGDLSLRRVQYTYGGSEPIIQNVSFTIKQGHSCGILGRTGSGKTTLVKLIPRLLDPPEGTIFIGNEDIRTFQRSALRRALGVVPQDVFLFSETIRNNICFARPNATDKEIDLAVEAAGLVSDLPFFPLGLQTLVGEKGVTLSGGQKQRIAIARALIADPEILILDDALSAVDAETEERILEGIFRIRKGRTTLLVSHRVSALSRCNRIIVLENGVVTGEGSHEDLMKIGGFYKEIADMQKLEQIEEAIA